MPVGMQDNCEKLRNWSQYSFLTLPPIGGETGGTSLSLSLGVLSATWRFFERLPPPAVVRITFPSVFSGPPSHPCLPHLKTLFPQPYSSGKAGGQEKELVKLLTKGTMLDMFMYTVSVRPCKSLRARVPVTRKQTLKFTLLEIACKVRPLGIP